ncbi:codanin-1-like [Saccoglossus kowalevskii]|uniref:Codanin-1-like n=1 Tax=Saccoglossus kowalevskii TaxID=10224 RepID=A0ABM0MWB1_SACKO|nr:PREDICTED: codanin-1-like [Saccoglossus kowalevskii]
MAAVVALLLQGKVLPKDVIIWLKKEQKQDCSTALQLLNQTNLKSEFVPYLLDNLREQSSPLLVSSQSNGCSPVKTPRSLSRSASSTRTSSNRVQLFVSPNKNASPRLQLTTPKTDRQSVTPRSAKSEDSFSRKEFVYSPYSPYFEDSKHRDSHYTPRHKSLAQSRDHATNLSPEILLPRGYRKKTGDDDRYKGQYHQSPGTKRKSGNKRRSNEHKLKSVNEIHLDSLEDFPPISKPVVTRRIKPTPVSGDRLQNRTQTLFTSSPSLPSEQSAFTASEINHNQIETKTLSTPCKALDEERELLRIERQKQKVDVIAASPHKSELPLTGPITPTKSSINTMCKVEVIQPRRDRVTCINQLNLLADIYSCCVQEFLVPNITVELYFIIQLLTSRCISEETLSEDFSQDSEEINYLRTAHNCVFFAVTVLAKLHVHSALYKSKMKFCIIVSMVMCLTTVMRVVAAHLDLVKVVHAEGEGCFKSWEKFWLLSLVPSVLGILSLPKNKVTYLMMYAIGTMVFGVGGACWGAYKLYPDAIKYIHTGETAEVILGLPSAGIRYLILGITMMIYAFGLYFANMLLTAWKTKGLKRQ